MVVVIEKSDKSHLVLRLQITRQSFEIDIYQDNCDGSELTQKSVRHCIERVISTSLVHWLPVIYSPYGLISSYTSPLEIFPRSCKNTLIDMCERRWVDHRNRQAGLADNVTWGALADGIAECSASLPDTAFASINKQQCVHRDKYATRRNSQFTQCRTLISTVQLWHIQPFSNPLCSPC